MNTRATPPKSLARNILAGASGIEKSLSLIDRSSLNFLSALKEAEHTAPDQTIANALAWIAKDYSPILRAIHRLDESGTFGSALAKACGAHLEPSALLRAHAAITTEITGPSTYEISMALAESAIQHHELRSFVRYGVQKNLWDSCLLDFWREFSAPQMKTMCEMLMKADPKGRPAELLGTLLRDARYGVFSDEFSDIKGALEAIPDLALESGLPMAIDKAATHAETSSRQGALAFFELAMSLGMSLCGNDPRNFQMPEIKAHIEASMLSIAIARPATEDKSSLRV